MTGFSQNPWPDITAALERPQRRPAVCAVSYIAKDAPALLPLRNGDVLVCDAEEATIKAGLTSARALDAYVKRGVQVWSHWNLHAKVVVLSTKAWVGSMNASESSATRLIEAALATRERDQVQGARNFVYDLLDTSIQLDRKRIKGLLKIEPRVRAFIHRSQSNLPAVTPDDLESLVVIRTEEVLYTKAEMQTVEKSRLRAKAAMRNLGTRVRLRTVSWNGGRRPCANGDWVIEQRSDSVLAPSKVVHIAEARERRIIWLAEPSDLTRRVPAEQVEAAVEKTGTKWGRGFTQRLGKKETAATARLFQDLTP